MCISTSGCAHMQIICTYNWKAQYQYCLNNLDKEHLHITNGSFWSFNSLGTLLTSLKKLENILLPGKVTRFDHEIHSKYPTTPIYLNLNLQLTVLHHPKKKKQKLQMTFNHSHQLAHVLDQRNTDCSYNSIYKHGVSFHITPSTQFNICKEYAGKLTPSE